jgi:hypothetical protein
LKITIISGEIHETSSPGAEKKQRKKKKKKKKKRKKKASENTVGSFEKSRFIVLKSKSIP